MFVYLIAIAVVTLAFALAETDAGLLMAGKAHNGLVALASAAVDERIIGNILVAEFTDILKPCPTTPFTHVR